MKRQMENTLSILLILLILVIIISAVYMSIRTNMSVAEHLGLNGGEYWWYVITQHG